MSEVLTKFARRLDRHMCLLDQKKQPVTWAALSAVFEEAARDLEPNADPVPELPEWVRLDEHEDWQVTLEEGNRFWIDPSLPPNDLDRIAEACRILAARERARRAP